MGNRLRTRAATRPSGETLRHDFIFTTDHIQLMLSSYLGLRPTTPNAVRLYPYASSCHLVGTRRHSTMIWDERIPSERLTSPYTPFIT